MSSISFEERFEIIITSLGRNDETNLSSSSYVV
jgi:hypothetical protein